MSFQIPALGVNPLAYEGVLAVNPANVVLALRAPTTSDTNYPDGTIWIDKSNLSAIGIYEKGATTAGLATWITLGTSSTGPGTFTNLTATGTVNLNTTGAGVTSIGTGGTGATNIGNATGGTAITGPATLTGNLSLTGAGTGLRIEGGAVTDSIGTATLAAGTVTVANTNIAATDRIIAFHIAPNASTGIGTLTYTISAGASFTITSLNATAATEANDLSTIGYLIVRQL
jgi:hypothetical protein